MLLLDAAQSQRTLQNIDDGMHSMPGTWRDSLDGWEQENTNQEYLMAKHCTELMYDAAKFGRCCAEHGLPNILEESLKQSQLDNDGQDTLTLAEVQDEVTHKGFELFNPTDNGDCFYECLSWLLDGRKSEMELREEAVNLISRNNALVDLASWATQLDARGGPNPYRGKNGEVITLDDYVYKILVEKMWADDNIIFLMAHQYPDILALSSRKEFTQNFSNGLMGTQRSGFILYLPAKKHFVAFRPKLLPNPELSHESSRLPSSYTSSKFTILPSRKRGKITGWFNRYLNRKAPSSTRIQFR